MDSLQEFQAYKLSLSRSSNTVSSILLSESWDRHTDNFDTKTLKTAEGNVKKLYSNKASTWKSSLSNTVCPEELFLKNIPKCTDCLQNTDIDYSNFNKLVKNKCKCVNENGEDPKQLYKPVFSRHKTVKNNEIPEPKLQKSYDTKPYNYKVPKEMEYDIEIVDEEKANTSNINKIIFRTAKEQYCGSNPGAMRLLKSSKKSQGKFVSPMIRQVKPEPIEVDDIEDRLKHLDPKMVELIENEIIDKGTPIGWDDIAGLQLAKSVIQEAVVWPLLRPDIFTGLRRPPKGILLFGPPGTGKTLIGKCVAAQCNATFFSISASSLTSKWIGDGEKMVRALFAVARCRQPAVIFIDEIDSLLTQRCDSEHESSRRIKTEFLVQFDGAATAEEDRILIIGATNRPQELDEAARRRLVKRLYIPLPEQQARKQIISNLLTNESNSLNESEVTEVSQLTEGFSGADMMSLCSEAAMGPIRSVPLSQIVSIHKDNMRPVNFQDFKNALERVRPSVSQNDLGQYVKWNQTYGQGV